MLLPHPYQGVGAVASRRAAELYGLEILEENIQDAKDNVTRFIKLARYYIQCCLCCVVCNYLSVSMQGRAAGVCAAVAQCVGSVCISTMHKAEA